LRGRLTSGPAKCGKLIKALHAAREQVCQDANRSFRDLLRKHIQSAGTSPHALFDQLSKGSSSLTMQALQGFLKSIVSDKLTPARQDMALQQYASTGISKLNFLVATQEFLECAKEIAITTKFDVKDSVSIRKLEVGEVVEVIGETTSEKNGLDRVNCRALNDQIEGFVTLRGNQGTAFMKPSVKPFHLCQVEAPLFKTCDSSGEEVCRLKPGDVLELIQGPTAEAVVEVQRVRGKCSKDGKMGWATLSDFKDQDKTDKFLVCSATTAMTNAFDIIESKAMRKVEVGEVLVQLEEPKEDTARSLTRVRVKARKDGLEGWCTMKGNKGSAFVSETTSHRECRRATPLHTSLSSDSKVLRTLDEGEVFDVQHGPTAEKKEGALLTKGRNISTATEGWFSSSGPSFPKWAPTHTCVRSADLKDSMEDTAKVLRALEVGETLCALQPPIRQESGVLLMQVQAERDGAVGFAIVKDVQEGTKPSKLFLKPSFKAA